MEVFKLKKYDLDGLASDLAEGFHIAHGTDAAENRQEDQRAGYCRNQS